ILVSHITESPSPKQPSPLGPNSLPTMFNDGCSDSPPPIPILENKSSQPPYFHHATRKRQRIEAFSEVFEATAATIRRRSMRLVEKNLGETKEYTWYGPLGSD